MSIRDVLLTSPRKYEILKTGEAVWVSVGLPEFAGKDGVGGQA